MTQSDEQVIWLMDSDFCMNCGTELADVDGYCWWCWEQLEDTNAEDRDYEIWGDDFPEQEATS